MLSNAVCRRLHRVLQHLAGVEVRRCLAWREILEGFRVQLQDVGGWHDGPQLFPGVERVAWGIHMLLERIDPKIDRARDSRPHRLSGEPVVLDLEMDFPILIAYGEQL